jgi:hypothetical protein
MESGGELETHYSNKQRTIGLNARDALIPNSATHILTVFQTILLYFIYDLFTGENESAPLIDRIGRTCPSDIPPTTDMRDFAR